MTRLTEKHGEMYIYNYDKDCDNDEREMRMIETHNAIVNKLGVVEDIEEELGIDLVTLDSALKYGIYYKLGFDIPPIEKGVYWCGIGVNFIFSRYSKSFKIDLGFGTLEFFLKDYGKTWSLTKEELEK